MGDCMFSIFRYCWFTFALYLSFTIHITSKRHNYYLFSKGIYFVFYLFSKKTCYDNNWPCKILWLHSFRYFYRKLEGINLFNNSFADIDNRIDNLWDDAHFNSTQESLDAIDRSRCMDYANQSDSCQSEVFI